MDNRYDTFDPRPAGRKFTTSFEVNNLLIRDQAKPMGTTKYGKPIRSNWYSMKPKYQNYVLTPERKLELIQLQEMFLDNLKQQALEYDGDPLSNEDGVHVTGTINQANAMDVLDGFHKNKWFKIKGPLVTASWFKVRFFLNSNPGINLILFFF